jgi:hypothetical protein
MERKIKTIKEFIKDGPAQFDVILRRDKGEPVEFFVSSVDGESRVDYKEMVYPPQGSEGLIKIVKRISDDGIFHTNDMIEAKDVGSCFIIGFNEDLVHCTVLDVFSQGDGTAEPVKIQVQINDIEVHGDNSVVDEEYEGIEGEGEDHWPEPDSAIDEW